ncbi:MAG: hypothetical protein ACR2IE_03860 [Candidatus Sumerlaeaceae bacterium]
MHSFPVVAALRSVRSALPAIFLCGLMVVISACASTAPPPSNPGLCKQGIDVPLNYGGREYICLYNLERLLDAKQEWARDNNAGRGALVPSPQSLANKYFRNYKYGRRSPCDDERQKYDAYQPICPSGGQYIIGTVGERPKCSQHGDLLRDFDQHIRVPHTH